MKVSDFDFDLPNELIAQYPKAQRNASRLLHLERHTGHVSHKQFKDIIDLLDSGDLLVFNNTRVIPARIYGHKVTGGKVEILVERILSNNHFIAHIRSSKRLDMGSLLFLGEDKKGQGNGIEARVLSKKDGLFELALHSQLPLLNVLSEIGHIPLPPYIDRADESVDQERYQTVYNSVPGAVAAPTAGLHFDEQLLASLQQKGVNSCFVTLHVGAGTFQPIRTENITEHNMHSEYVAVPIETVNAILATKEAGKKVIAVGTTSVRAVESAALSAQEGNVSEQIAPFFSDTSIFIYPGKKFHIIDGLLTNFHLPKSTLIMLVCAFAGYENTMSAYKIAIENEYRFFSYGDAMYIG